MTVRKSDYEVACEWIRANPQRILNWLPRCSPKFVDPSDFTCRSVKEKVSGRWVERMCDPARGENHAVPATKQLDTSFHTFGTCEVCDRFEQQHHREWYDGVRHASWAYQNGAAPSSLQDLVTVSAAGVITAVGSTDPGFTDLLSDSLLGPVGKEVAAFAILSKSQRDTFFANLEVPSSTAPSHPLASTGTWLRGVPSGLSFVDERTFDYANAARDASRELLQWKRWQVVSETVDDETSFYNAARHTSSNTFPKAFWDSYPVNTGSENSAFALVVAYYVPALMPNTLNKNRGCIQKCPPGFYNNWWHSSGARRGMDCVPAQPGFIVASSNAFDQLKCVPGFVTKRHAQTQCAACPAGAYANPEGTSCIPCQPGFFATQVGSLQCSQCAPGSFSADFNQAVCQPCAVGSYQSALGAIACEACAAISPGFTTRLAGTTTQDLCVCSEGYYFDFSQLRCNQCEVEGLECAVGTTNVKNVQHPMPERLPTVKKGFWALPERPELVYRCTSEFRCPGADLNLAN